MGLDQYCFALLRDDCIEGDDGYLVPKPEDQRKYELEEVGYWRKHPNLQGLMEELYQRRGGAEIFNCIPLELRQEDINYVRQVVLGEALPPTHGFFFGSDSDEHYKQHDLATLAKAEEAIANGKVVIYDSWW